MLVSVASGGGALNDALFNRADETKALVVVVSVDDTCTLDFYAGYGYQQLKASTKTGINMELAEVCKKESVQPCCKLADFSGYKHVFYSSFSLRKRLRRRFSAVIAEPSLENIKPLLLKRQQDAVTSRHRARLGRDQASGGGATFEGRRLEHAIGPSILPLNSPPLYPIFASMQTGISPLYLRRGSIITIYDACLRK